MQTLLDPVGVSCSCVSICLMQLQPAFLVSMPLCYSPLMSLPSLEDIPFRNPLTSWQCFPNPEPLPRISGSHFRIRFLYSQFGQGCSGFDGGSRGQRRAGSLYQFCAAGGDWWTLKCHLNLGAAGSSQAFTSFPTECPSSSSTLPPTDGQFLSSGYNDQSALLPDLFLSLHP